MRSFKAGLGSLARTGMGATLVMTAAIARSDSARSVAMAVDMMPPFPTRKSAPLSCPTVGYSITPSPASRTTVDTDNNLIVALGCFRRDIAPIEIALNELDSPFLGRPVAAAATGLEHDQIARIERIAFRFAHCDGRAVALRKHRHEPWQSRLPAHHAPRRKFGAVQIRVQKARL